MPATPSKTLLISINIIYFTILMVMVIFGLAVAYLAYVEAIETDPANVGVFKNVIYIMTPIGVSAGYFIYNKSLAEMQTDLSLRGKLGKFQGAMLIRAACVEVPGMFGVVCTFLTGDLFFLIITVIMAAIFIFWRPSADSIIADLKLSEKEAMILTDPEGVVE